MTSPTNPWSKVELQVYILLLCASADSIISDDELKMIQSKTNQETFDKIYAEFLKDDEDERLDKIDTVIQLHEYSMKELADLRREMYEIFFSDCNFSLMERNLDRILDNMLY